MAVTGTPTTPLELDDTDRAILLAVIKHRRSHKCGPRWTEVREALGSDYTRTPWTSHRADFQLRRPLHFFRAQHVDLDEEELQEAYLREARKALVIHNARADKLRPRLMRLRQAGYVVFDDTPSGASLKQQGGSGAIAGPMRCLRERSPSRQSGAPDVVTGCADDLQHRDL
jgi:hypothetical protein